MTATNPLSLFKGVILPLLLWGLYTPFSAPIDLFVSRLFYHDGHFSSNPVWEWIYHYGIWPAWIVVGLAFLGVILSFIKGYSSWRIPSLYLILTLAIGSGLILHAGFKDHWGRPRPRQVVEFGGTQHFRPYYKPNFFEQPEPSKSFGCGHCSMGFFFFSAAILGALYRQQKLYWLSMGLAWGLGSGLGLARIAQGGHFLSDVLAACLIMWLTAWGLAYILFNYMRWDHERANTKTM
jgi:membrane-associated PAP2 superfamily phosphatase